jgi:hypothetical protein
MQDNECTADTTLLKVCFLANMQEMKKITYLINYVYVLCKKKENRVDKVGEMIISLFEKSYSHGIN